MRAQARLIDRLCRGLKPGRLEWIGLRRAHRGEVVSVETAMAIAGLGLDGDHRAVKTSGSARQVTLISREFIGQIAHFMGVEDIAPELLRRNLVVSGMNLNALRHQQIRIGDVLFEASAHCHPCSRMEAALGEGAVAAMLGHGGLCLKVLQGGQLKLGDIVAKMDDPIGV